MDKLNILIVNEYIEILDLIGNNINRIYSCDIKKATNGRDALNLMNKYQFDLVILDMDTSEITGMRILQWAKKTNNIADILAISAWDSVQVAREVIAQGAVDYMTKPFELEILNAKIKNILFKKKRQ